LNILDCHPEQASRLPQRACPERAARVEGRAWRAPFLKATFALCVLIIFAGLSSAQTLRGHVKNGTTNKSAAGDDVILLSLGQGMEESGRTKTDAQGNFSFKLDNSGGPHLIRAIHQGVTYHAMVPPGTTSADVIVYDVSKKLDAITATADVMRFQAQGNELQGIRLFAVDNSSQPPRTQMSDQSFEFYLPEGAQVDQGMAMTANGQPLNTMPVPQKEKNRYAFIFPLRPGETQFQVGFHLPYNGTFAVDPKPLYPAQHFVVMIPKTMQFVASPGSAYQAMQDPRQADAIVQVASNTKVGQSLGFKISGTGMLAQPDENAGAPGPVQGNERATNGGAVGRDTRPGGGLGPPIDAPDPLEKYRWYVLGGFGILLAAGAIFILSRSGRNTPVPDFVAADVQVPHVPPSPKPQPSSRSAVLLEALKEELFQLELDRRQGNISQQEYVKAKEALDQTLDRALKRETAKA